VQDIYRNGAATAGFDFVDTSGFSTVTAVDFDMFVTFVNAASTFEINGDTPTAVATQSGSCGGPTRSFSMPTPSLYVPGGTNQLRFTTANIIDISDNLSGIGTEIIILTITGSVVGGGGDPHLIAPYVPRMELHDQLQLMDPARDVQEFDALLLASSTTEFRGMVRGEPGTDRFYFTSFSVGSMSESISIGRIEEDGRAYASMEHDGTAISCASQGDEFELELAGSAFLRLSCSNAVERAAANRLMQENFGSHIAHAEAVISLETPHFSAELFFIQKDAGRLDFGFYDFSLIYHTDESLSGIFTNDHSGHDEAARGSMTLEESIRRRFMIMSHSLSDSVTFK